jgi:hypothetical protein
LATSANDLENDDLREIGGQRSECLSRARARCGAQRQHLRRMTIDDCLNAIAFAGTADITERGARTPPAPTTLSRCTARITIAAITGTSAMFRQRRSGECFGGAAGQELHRHLKCPAQHRYRVLRRAQTHPVNCPRLAQIEGARTATPMPTASERPKTVAGCHSGAPGQTDWAAASIHLRGDQRT